MDVEKIHDVTLDQEIPNDIKSLFVNYWVYLLEQYGIPLGSYCIKVAYSIYVYFTLFNVMLFVIKCVPAGIIICKFIKDFYVTSRERIKLKKVEMEELQLQIEILKTKLSVGDGEIVELEDFSRRELQKLRQVRARVREIIARNPELRNNYLNRNGSFDDSPNSNVKNTSDEGKIIVELLRELKYDDVVIPESDPEVLSCGEHSHETDNPEMSVYSSAIDADAAKRDCRVKIIKVTNVYKVAYLRHFIKQKRLRRANRQSLLRKKTESIKKLLDDWQKTLSMVINNKLSLLDRESPQIEIASQEAMGDFSKPNFYNSSDSDSDFRNSADNCHDDYSMSWTQNQYRPIYNYNNYDVEIPYSYYKGLLTLYFVYLWRIVLLQDFLGDSAIAREYYDVRNYETYNYQEGQHNCNKGLLYVVPEETNSQMEIKELQNDEN